VKKEVRMKIWYLFALMLVGFVAGCGPSGNKVTAPEKFTAPTAPMGAGTGGGKNDSGDAKTEKFIP
jgi:hypothetical protein